MCKLCGDFVTVCNSGQIFSLYFNLLRVIEVINWSDVQIYPRRVVVAAVAAMFRSPVDGRI
jgi:hypothetical protein